MEYGYIIVGAACLMIGEKAAEMVLEDAA